MAALASEGRRLTRTAENGKIERGPSSAVGLLTRLRGPLPDPEQVTQPAPRPAPPPLWAPVEATGDPIVDLRLELAAARRAGVEFDQAWRIARGRVAARLPDGKYHGQRREFMDVTAGTRQAWAEAYHRTGERLYAVEALRGLASSE